MKLIVGLGNPGAKYEKTRHNLGFRVAEKFLKDFEPVAQTVWKKSEKLKSLYAAIDWQPKSGTLEKIILALPQAFMNNSGMAVKLLAGYYKIEPENIWVLHDELDLPLGSIRIRNGGAAAGHHGVESIIDSLGTDKFWRFRLGIGIDKPHSGRDGREGGNPKVSKHYVGGAENYVLSNFGPEESSKIRELIKNASNAMSYALEKGLEKSMNRFNTK